jgi:hypothetical protein
MLLLTDSLTWLASKMGATDDFVQSVLQGKSPSERAAELVRNSRWAASWTFAGELFEGGQEAIEAMDDPMIALARQVDAEARAVRAIMEAQDERKQQATPGSPKRATRWPARVNILTPRSPCAWPLERCSATRNRARFRIKP